MLAGVRFRGWCLGLRAQDGFHISDQICIRALCHTMAALVVASQHLHTAKALFTSPNKPKTGDNTRFWEIALFFATRMERGWKMKWSPVALRSDQRDLALNPEFLFHIPFDSPYGGHSKICKCLKPLCFVGKDDFVGRYPLLDDLICVVRSL